MSDSESYQEDQNQDEVETKTSTNHKLPVMLDLVFDLANLIILVVPLAVAGISFISGASWLDIVLRTGITLIVVGFFLMIITRKVVDLSLEVTNQMLENATQINTNLE